MIQNAGSCALERHFSLTSCLTGGDLQLSVMDVSKVEGRGQQHDAYVCREPRPEVMSEDQDIHPDDGDHHHGHDKYRTRSASHAFSLLRAGTEST
jgi:hypothetical protein